MVAQLHALVYGYQLAIGRLPVASDRHDQAVAELLQHRIRRDRLIAWLTRRSAEVPVPEPAYRPSVEPRDGASSARLIRTMLVALQPFGAIWLAAAGEADREWALTTFTTIVDLARAWNAPLPVWPGWRADHSCKRRIASAGAVWTTKQGRHAFRRTSAEGRPRLKARASASRKLRRRRCCCCPTAYASASHARTSSSTSSGRASRKAWSTLDAGVDLDPAEPRRGDLAGEDDVAVQPVPADGERRKAHPGMERDPGLLRQDVERAQRGGDRHDRVEDLTNSGSAPAKWESTLPSAAQVWVWFTLAKLRPQRGQRHIGAGPDTDAPPPPSADERAPRCRTPVE